MPGLKPPRGRMSRRSAEECLEVAEAILASPMGQEALQQGWGRGLYMFVMEWGTAPTQPKTIDELKRAANALKWDLLEMRKNKPGDELGRALLSLYESADAVEDELRTKFLV